MAYKKPQDPLTNNGFGIYPLTTADQVILSDGSRLEKAGKINADKLDGRTLADIMLEIYPVGAVYISVNSTSPASLFGGTWESISGRFLLGADSTYTAGSTGGETTHKLTRNELPNYKIGDLAMIVPGFHANWNNGGIEATNLGNASSTKPGIASANNNTITSDIQYGYRINSYGGGGAHNNMPPYIAVYMWKRVS